MGLVLLEFRASWLAMSVHRDVQGPERGVGAMATTDVKPTDPGEIVHRPRRDDFDLAPLRRLELLQDKLEVRGDLLVAEPLHPGIGELHRQRLEAPLLPVPRQPTRYELLGRELIHAAFVVVLRPVGGLRDLIRRDPAQRWPRRTLLGRYGPGPWRWRVARAGGERTCEP